ncbi:MAG: L-rhamnose isomerase [Alphaproteobacteria bacterium]
MVTQKIFEQAKAQFEDWGVDVTKALNVIKDIPISIHCWQGDDVGGFEAQDAALSGGGIQSTGDYPGKARNTDELRADLNKALSLIPGSHRLNLHAIYLDTDQKIERNKIEKQHFTPWVDWAKEQKIGLDFNPSFFSHEQAKDNFTLAHPNQSVRDFWIEHGKATREIGAYFGQELGTPCVNNIWIPDGFKDNPVDRLSPRERLIESLDSILAQSYSKEHLKDAVESKLFGIGVEAYTVGSHEFYMGYAMKKNILLCIDAGHFHLTESIADKLSALSPFIDEFLLHISRPIRWDSDHVVILDDTVKEIARELVFHDFLKKTNIGLDFFDGTINRLASWVIGTRNVQKALLMALLQPKEKLFSLEHEQNYTDRFIITEELKDLPYGVIWQYFCEQNERPYGTGLLDDIHQYEKDIQLKRGL